MLRRIGAERKIVILIIALLAVTASAIIVLNRSLFRDGMRSQLTEYQLPLVSDSALAGELEEKFNAIMSSIADVRALVDTIRAGTDEQSGALGSITGAMSQVDKNADETAAQAAEMTGVSSALAAQVQKLRDNIDALGAILAKKR